MRNPHIAKFWKKQGERLKIIRPGANRDVRILESRNEEQEIRIIFSSLFNHRARRLVVKTNFVNKDFMVRTTPYKKTKANKREVGGQEKVISLTQLIQMIDKTHLEEFIVYYGSSPDETLAFFGSFSGRNPLSKDWEVKRTLINSLRTTCIDKTCEFLDLWAKENAYWSSAALEHRAFKGYEIFPGILKNIPPLFTKFGIAIVAEHIRLLYATASRGSNKQPWARISKTNLLYKKPGWVKGTIGIIELNKARSDEEDNLAIVDAAIFCIAVANRLRYMEKNGLDADKIIAWAAESDLNINRGVTFGRRVIGESYGDFSKWYEGFRNLYPIREDRLSNSLEKLLSSERLDIEGLLKDNNLPAMLASCIVIHIFMEVLSTTMQKFLNQ